MAHKAKAATRAKRVTILWCFGPTPPGKEIIDAANDTMNNTALGELFYLPLQTPRHQRPMLMQLSSEGYCDQRAARGIGGRT